MAYQSAIHAGIVDPTVAVLRLLPGGELDYARWLLRLGVQVARSALGLVGGLGVLMAYPNTVL